MKELEGARWCFTWSFYIDSPSCPFSHTLSLVSVSPLVIGKKSSRERSMARKPGCGWPFASVYGGEYCCREYCSSWRCGKQEWEGGGRGDQEIARDVDGEVTPPLTFTSSHQICALVGQSVVLGYLSDYFSVENPTAEQTRDAYLFATGG